MELTEDIKCHKCFSFNPSSMNHCRYCHQGFGRSINVINSEPESGDEKQSKRNLIIAGTAAILIVATGYLLFK